VRVIGVDEHRWSHTRRTGDDGYVTVIIDLTPVLEHTERVRLLDLVAGWLPTSHRSSATRYRGSELCRSAPEFR
jgi:hypothetical protein